MIIFLHDIHFLTIIEISQKKLHEAHSESK